VSKYTSEYDFWTEEWIYNYTVIAKKGSDGTHFWKAESNEWIWVAKPYYEWYYYGPYAAMERVTSITNETMPTVRMPMNITTPASTPYEKFLHSKLTPIQGSGYWEYNITGYGYDLNGDGACDTVLGNSTEVHAITVHLPFLTRELPVFAFAGDEIVVNVTFHPTEDINSVGLHDEAPAGWKVSVDKTWCSPTADSAKATNNVSEYIWYNIANCTNVTASYKVRIPENIMGEYCFNGYMEYYNGTSGPYKIAIRGDGCIFVYPFPINITLPETAVRGYCYNVTIAFTPDIDAFNSIGLHIETPDGWNTSAHKEWCSPTADFAKAEENTAEYIWYGPYSAGTNFSATYDFCIPEGTEEGYYLLKGYLEYYNGSAGPYKVPLRAKVKVIPGIPIRGVMATEII